MVKVYVTMGADVNPTGERYYQPLNNSCDNGHREIAEYLVGGGADVRFFFDALDSIFLLNKRDLPKTRDCIRFLLEKGAKVEFIEDISNSIVTASLGELPENYELPESLRSKITYDKDRRVLVLKGELSNEEMKKLDNLSSDKLYKEAISKFWRIDRYAVMVGVADLSVENYKALAPYLTHVVYEKPGIYRRGFIEVLSERKKDALFEYLKGQNPDAISEHSVENTDVDRSS